MSYTVLVTGGAGFIGSHFIRHLLRHYEDIRVINADKLTYCGNPWNLRDVEGDERYRFVRADLSDPRQVKELLVEPVHEVVHFAAETHVDRSIRGAEPFLRTNVLGTHALLEAARQADVKKFVHISTDEVYGSIPAGQADENAPLAPSNPYAASKAASDLLCLSYWRTHRFPVVITRCTNNYGPNQYPEKLIPHLIGRLMKEEPIPLYGDGMQKRDWIHVRDHCRAVDLVRIAGRVGEVYNIGTENTRTNLEVTYLLLRWMNKPDSLIRHVADRPGHDVRYSLDSGKIRRDLGWSPTVSFEEGLKETVEWYLKHADWWESVSMRKQESGEEQ
jgi:dTDP-glucose 4,6-dehydratase